LSFVNKDQIRRAKEVNIVDYILRHEPKNIRKIGDSYRLIDHPSVAINDSGWYWHSHSTGSKSALDYLVTVRGYTFREAVLKLKDEKSWDHTSEISLYETNLPSPIRADTAPTKRKPFVLPPANKNNNRVIAYLKSRGIERETIIACIENKTLYESAKYSNCVFVGMDDTGEARYATLRSIFSSYKCDVEGSNKSFGFLLPAADNEIDTVAVFESAIDCLSHQSLSKQSLTNQYHGWRLSLGCTASTALIGFLERKPKVTHCLICTDNDGYGELAAERIKTITGISTERCLPGVGKDWNEYLLAQQKTKRIENRAFHGAERS
jgi:hypothetical protein